jgi:hypothetical protein
LANLQRGQDHLASSDGPALRPITLERSIPLADTGTEAETSSRDGDDYEDRTNRRTQSSMAARAYVVNRNVQEMVPRLHQRYHITIPTTLASAVAQITQCYVYSSSIAGRYGNPRFAPQWWNTTDPTQPKVTMLDYISKLDAAAQLANVKYPVMLNCLITGEHILRPSSDELTAWRGAVNTARYDFNLMSAWCSEVGELQGRFQALIVFLYRHLVIEFHKEPPRHRLITAALGVRLRNNDVRYLREMYTEAIALFHKLSPLDRDIPELQTMTRLMLHTLGEGPVNGSKEDKIQARKNQSYLSDTIRSIKDEDGTPDATGIALDAILNRAITACIRGIGENPGTQQEKPTDAPRSNKAERRAREKERRNKGRQDKQDKAAAAAATARAHAVSLEEEDSDRDDDDGSVSATPPPKKQRKKDKPARVKAVRAQGPKLTEAELNAFIVPHGHRYTGCYQCGSPHHQSGACDGVFLQDSAQVFSSTVKLEAILARILKASKNKEEAKKEFEKQMGWLKQTRKYKGMDAKGAGYAAERWERDYGQAHQAFQSVVATHSF